MTTLKQLKQVFADNPHTSSFKVSKSSNQTDAAVRTPFIIRLGFFHTNGVTSQQVANKVVNVAKAVGINLTILDHGEVWKDFKGGAPLVKQSHWWVKVDTNE